MKLNLDIDPLLNGGSQLCHQHYWQELAVLNVPLWSATTSKAIGFRNRSLVQLPCARLVLGASFYVAVNSRV